MGLSAPGEFGEWGGVNCVFIINLIFLIFLVFRGEGGVGGKFAISQRMWGIEVSVAIILGVSIRGISDGFIRGRGSVDCNFVTNLIFLLFLVFVVLVE